MIHTASPPAADPVPGFASPIDFEQTGCPVPAFASASYGDAGAYEWLRGRVHGRVDPLHPLNRGIALIDMAPRDVQGWVNYGADIDILKPVDMRRGNGWLLYDVANRGNKRALQRIDGGVASNRPQRPEHTGVGYLLRRGFTLVWSAWQGDVAAGNERLCLDLPVATAGGQPCTGTAREEFILDAPAIGRDDGIVEVSARCFLARLSYPAADTDAAAQLTVRARAQDPRLAPAGMRWRYVDERTIEITHPEAWPFDRGAIHEFIYRARDPKVMGIGLASIRDVVSFLRHDAAGARGDPNPLQGHVRHALGFGASQSGRVLRDFLHQGFNQDLQGRAVFDAVMPVIAGSRRAFLNMPFSQPGRFSRQHEDHDFPGDQFPFAYGLQHDPLSGQTDGILRRAEAAGVSPKLMHLDSDSEFYSARSSLVITDGEGQDAVLPENVRFYLASSVAHVDDALPPEVAGAPGNGLTYASLARALIEALVAWVEQGTPPPDSCRPRRADKTLLPLADVQRLFARIPNAVFPAQLNELQCADPATLPPRPGPHYPVWVPVVDVDGNGAAGVPHPLTTAPVGTHTGWQLRRHGFAEGELFSIFGSFWKFPDTEAEGRLRGDARRSFEARYGSPAGWSDCLAEAMKPLVLQRFLLQEDCERLIEQARRDGPSGMGYVASI